MASKFYGWKPEEEEEEEEERSLSHRTLTFYGVDCLGTVATVPRLTAIEPGLSRRVKNIFTRYLCIKSSTPPLLLSSSGTPTTPVLRP